MTTITIHQDLPLKKVAFGNVLELFTALEEQGYFVTLRELENEEVTRKMHKKAEAIRHEFQTMPQNFSNI